MGVIPQTEWRDSHHLFRFGTKDEAIKAVHDPYFRMFSPTLDWDSVTVVEVKMFQPYASDLTAAWEVVGKLNRLHQPLELRADGENWLAAFGACEPIAAPTAPLAVCLAALRARGIDAILDTYPATKS